MKYLREFERWIVRGAALQRRVRAKVGRLTRDEQCAAPIVLRDEDMGEHGPEPIFIIGVHRSGTTLVRRMVDSHPDIACPPETFFMRHWALLLDDELGMRGLRDMGFTEEVATRMLGKQMASFHRAYAAAKGKARWADKTPQYACILTELDALTGCRACFLWVLRHPMDVAYSIWSRKLRLAQLWPPAPSSWEDAIDAGGVTCVRAVATYVRVALERVEAFAQERPERTLEVPYDRLVADPSTVVASMCRHVGEPYAASMLTPWLVSHDRGVEDPVARGTHGFRASHRTWLGWDRESREVAWEVLAQVSSRLGYGEDSSVREESIR